MKHHHHALFLAAFGALVMTIGTGCRCILVYAPAETQPFSSLAATPANENFTLEAEKKTEATTSASVATGSGKADAAASGKKEEAEKAESEAADSEAKQ